MSVTTTAFTGSVPENYDRYLVPYIFEPYAKDLLARTDHAGVSHVLETACGTGSVTALLRNTLPPEVRLVATDLNGDMITIGKKILADKGIEWMVADAQALPFENDSFDLLVCQFGLMFIPDKATALKEAYRVVRLGGRIVFNTWDKLENNPAFYVADQVVKKYFPKEPPSFFHIPFSMYDEKELQSLFEKAGFRDIRIELVKKEGTSPSSAATATGMLEGTPMYPTIQQRGPELLPRIKKDLEEQLASRFGDAPMISSLQAWVVTAEK